MYTCGGSGGGRKVIKIWLFFLGGKRENCRINMCLIAEEEKL